MSDLALWVLTVLGGLLAAAPDIASGRRKVIFIVTFFILGVVGYLGNVHQRQDETASEIAHDKVVLDLKAKVDAKQTEIDFLTAAESELLVHFGLPVPYFRGIYVNKVASRAASGGHGYFVYISDAYGSDSFTGAVDVYGYPSLKRLGILTGDLLEPQGICTDGWHLFITNTMGSNIYEFDKNAAKPKIILSDAGYHPSSCAYDQSTGQLAVTNIISTDGQPGNVAIYAHASGHPTYKRFEGLSRYYSATFDDRGQLFVEGTGVDGSRATLAMFPAGGTLGTKIRFDAMPSWPGQLGWDGKYVTLGADVGIYRLRVSKGEAQITGTTKLEGGVGAYFIEGNTIFAVDAVTQSAASYSYPHGGAPTKRFGDHLSQPIGITAIQS